MLYAAAGFLQSFVMAMHAGADFPTDADGPRYLGDQHMPIFQEMAASPRSHEKGDPVFEALCKAIKAKSAAHAVGFKGVLDELFGW